LHKSHNFTILFGYFRYIILAMTILEAIARMEGFYQEGSRAQRNNNPGNINWGEFASKHGATGPETLKNGGAGRFAHFPDEATGFAAMKSLLQSSGYKGLTIRQCLNRYAPPADGNDASVYEKSVCGWLRCLPTDIIDSFVEAA
jgi:hypothetical protein